MKDKERNSLRERERERKESIWNSEREREVSSGRKRKILIKTEIYVVEERKKIGGVRKRERDRNK